MTTSKRPRACDACHSIKIKCELGSTGGPGPCERCVRLGKYCIITPPKSQRDRVAELEAQVATLTRLLENQTLVAQNASPLPNGPVPENINISSHGSSQKKRKLEVRAISSDQFPLSLLRTLDEIVPLDLQRRLVEKYANTAVPLVPIVLLPSDWIFESLRETHPVLLQTIVYAMSTGNLSESDQDKLGSIVLDTFEALANDDNKKSVGLIQAIQIAVMWYRAPKNHRQIAAFKLAQRAADIAKDIGVGGSPKSLSINSTTIAGGEDPTTSLRAWLGCHIMSTAILVLMRNASFKTLGELDSWSLHLLDYLECSQSTDRILCHFVRGENLCERIVTDSKLLDFTICKDVSDLDTQLSIQTFQNSIIDWTTQIPTSPSCPTLGMYEHISTLYLHETVLHTPTNKKSFAAPFLAERLSMTDFPAPFIVTEQHVTSIHALKSAAHSLLNLFATFDLNTWITLPFLLFIGRVAYAEYILVKLYIATTAAGNTLGAYLVSDSLQVDRYLDQLIQIAKSAQQVDSNCPAARILLAPTRLKEWLLKYNVANGLVSASSDYGSKDVTPSLSDETQFDWDISALGYNGSDWELDQFLHDSSTLEFLPTS